MTFPFLYLTLDDLNVIPVGGRNLSLSENYVVNEDSVLFDLAPRKPLLP